MRRISRIKRPIGLLRSQSHARIPSPYPCFACKHQNTSFSTSSLRPAPKIPYTEKVRQRIWGTDKPPGLEDPYGDASVFDQLKKGTPEQELEARSEETYESRKEIEPATTEGPISLDDEGYEPATSIEGLQWIGGDAVWQPEEEFEGFLPADMDNHPALITAAVHRALVEVFALQTAGESLHVVSALPIEGNDWTLDAQITPSLTGATLQVSDLASLQHAIESLQARSTEEAESEVEPTESQEDVVADRSEVDPLKDGVVPSSDLASELAEPTESEEDVAADRSEVDSLTEARTYEDVIASWDPSWLQISFENTEVKFAVLKRTMQLTGIRLPDAAIKSTNTAKALLNHLLTPPKPRKLFEALAQKGDLFELGNVTVHEKRRSFAQKEADIGRLKVVMKELKARGLD